MKQKHKTKTLFVFWWPHLLVPFKARHIISHTASHLLFIANKMGSRPSAHITALILSQFCPKSPLLIVWPFVALIPPRINSTPPNRILSTQHIRTNTPHRSVLVGLSSHRPHHHDEKSNSSRTNPHHIQCLQVPHEENSGWSWSHVGEEVYDLWNNVHRLSCHQGKLAQAIKAWVFKALLFGLQWWHRLHILPRYFTIHKKRCNAPRGFNLQGVF